MLKVKGKPIKEKNAQNFHRERDNEKNAQNFHRERDNESLSSIKLSCDSIKHFSVCVYIKKNLIQNKEKNNLIQNKEKKNSSISTTADI